MVFTYYYLGERDEPITICCSRAPTLAEKKGMSACAWRMALAYKCIDSCACRVRDPLSSHLRIWELIIRVLLWLSVLVVGRWWCHLYLMHIFSFLTKFFVKLMFTLMYR